MDDAEPTPVGGTPWAVETLDLATANDGEASISLLLSARARAADGAPSQTRPVRAHVHPRPGAPERR